MQLSVPQILTLLATLPPALACALPCDTAPQNPTATIIPSTVFDSQADFNTSFAYLYPWGATHNGAARMDAAHVSLADQQLTLTAEYVTDQPEAGSAHKPVTINYLSGTVHAKETFTVATNGGYDFSAQVQAPVAMGTWPAFWLSGAKSWPPEIDMAEWKGSGKISYNTFNTSRTVTSHDVYYPDPSAWHSVKTEIRDENGKDVSINFYLDGKLQTTQYGLNYVGQALWFIINLQMEGSSGRLGPEGNTTYQIKELEVLSYNP